MDEEKALMENEKEEQEDPDNDQGDPMKKVACFCSTELCCMFVIGLILLFTLIIVIIVI